MCQYDYSPLAHPEIKIVTDLFKVSLALHCTEEATWSLLLHTNSG